VSTGEFGSRGEAVILKISKERGLATSGIQLIGRGRVERFGVILDLMDGGFGSIAAKNRPWFGLLPLNQVEKNYSIIP
jgi:hypothetical protein